MNDDPHDGCLYHGIKRKVNDPYIGIFKKKGNQSATDRLRTAGKPLPNDPSFAPAVCVCETSAETSIPDPPWT